MAGYRSVRQSWKVGIDVGGTFTDVVATDMLNGDVRAAKVLTRTKDPVGGIEAACHSVKLDLDDVSDLILGTTMATNAIVEGRLAKTALITTKGFADTLDIGRQNRRELYRMDVTPRPAPLVPKEFRLEAVERLDAEGRVVDFANPNGSKENIAGVCNKERNVFGMMPHPERACDERLGNTDGRSLFASLLKEVLA